METIARVAVEMHAARNMAAQGKRNQQQTTCSLLQTHMKVVSYSRWWFQRLFIFTPQIGEDFQFDSYFSDGLKPPSRYCLYICLAVVVSNYPMNDFLDFPPETWGVTMTWLFRILTHFQLVKTLVKS